MSALARFWSAHPRRELRELYVFSVFFSFASSLILIYEPVFFYVQGYQLSAIALYYALHYTLYTFLLPLGGKFAARYGLERSLALAMPLFVVYFLILAALPDAPLLYWLAWILLTLHKIFYWPAYHADVCRYGDAQNRGTELSWLFAFSQGAGVLAPLIGGVIATLFGFPALFVLAAALALVASVPLLRTREHVAVRSFAYGAPWRIITARHFRGALLTMIGWGENFVDLVFWPIFMFIMVGAADKLGYVVTITVVIMTVFGFVIGEVSDRWPRRHMLRGHVPFMVAGYLLRPLASSILLVLLADAWARAAFIGVQIPQWYHLYAAGRRRGPLRYVVALETTLAMSKAMLAFVLAGVFAVLTPYAGFVTAFLLAGAYALLYLFL